MSSTKWNSEIRMLFRETQVRYPHQKLEDATIKAYLEDWRDACDRVGWKRFEMAVKRARSYTKFFPMISEINEMTPDAINETAALHKEMRELQARKDAGEKFYTMGDVFRAVAKKIKAGEIKPSNPSWYEWARKFK